MTATQGLASLQDKILGLEGTPCMNGIMLATDFSPASERALEYGISLARRYDSRLYLVRVVSLDPITAPELAATSEMKLAIDVERALGEIVESGRLLGLAHEELVEQGALRPSIEKLIGAHKVDLVVLVTRGMGAVQKIFIGSSGEQIFRQARVPIITVGPAVKGEPLYEVEFQNILFATGFGAAAEREAAYALFLAQEHRARLTLLHVISRPREFNEEAMAEKRATIRNQMQALIPRMHELLCKLDLRVSFGHAVEEILAMSRETRADLMVMGAKTRKGMAGHLPHTKAYGVVGRARCPVLTIRS